MFKTKREKRAIYISHSGELLIWLVAILIVVSLVSLTFMHKSVNDENDYQIFMPDVDGLIVGSSVRMMGVEVGHVVKIKPVKDEVYVKFVITNPDVHIPHGSSVTVEFSGMAASKSLEIYLPDDKTYIGKDTPIMTVNSPKRLHDALSLLDDMYKKIGSIIHSCSSFGEKLNESDLKIDNTMGKSDFNEFLKYSDKFLDDSNTKAKEIRKSLEGLKENDK